MFISDVTHIENNTYNITHNHASSTATFHNDFTVIFPTEAKPEYTEMSNPIIHPRLPLQNKYNSIIFHSIERNTAKLSALFSNQSRWAIKYFQ